MRGLQDGVGLGNKKEQEVFNVNIKTIPHTEQRYPTVGDYWWAGDTETGTLEIRVSDMGDRRMEALVAFHEFFEAVACTYSGIREEEITDFDIKFEAAREDGNTDEPGNDPRAPYHKQHILAGVCERKLADELGVNWGEYDEKVNSL
jgi:hypothetical protein